MSSDEIRKRAEDNPLYEQGRVLPVLQPKQPPITEPDWRKVQAPKPFRVRPPRGAPNVLVILQDQTSYADPSTFGGPINFPTLDKLATALLHQPFLLVSTYPWAEVGFNRVNGLANQSKRI